MSWRVIAAIAQKDLLDAIRNRYLLVALLTPLSIALVMRLMLPGINNLSNLTIVVHDPDLSIMVSRLRETPQIKLVDVNSAATVRTEVEKSKASGALVVPANFDADVAAGKQPKLTVYVNNKKNIIEQANFKSLVERRVEALVQRPPPAELNWINIYEETDSDVHGFNLNHMVLPLLLLT